MARVNWIKKAGSDLLGALRRRFGLSQAEAGVLLGMTGARVNDFEASNRLPTLEVVRRLGKLAPLLEAPTGPPPPSDWEPVALRLARCQAKAAGLAVALTHELPVRAAAAAARLNAVETLPAALANAEAAAPFTLAQRQGQMGLLLQLQTYAYDEWHTHSGPAPAALLAARHAGLLAEAAFLAQVLAAEAAAPTSGALPDPPPS